MTKKIKYEKPLFIDLAGNDAMVARGQLDYLNCKGGNGALGSCSGGNGASSQCTSGNNAVTDCYAGNNAKMYTRCTSGKSATQSCSIGMGVRNS